MGDLAKYNLPKAERDAFMRSSTTALCASFAGVHKEVPFDQCWSQAYQLADDFWMCLLDYLDSPVEEKVWMRIVSVAYTANLIAHSKDINMDRAVIEGIAFAKEGWKKHQAWRAKHDGSENTQAT